MFFISCGFLRTCSLQNVSEECKNNSPNAKLETNTMKKCNSTKRSNLKHNDRKCYSSFSIEVYSVVMANLLASSISIWLRTCRRRVIIGTFLFPFGHFHFSYCWWLACFWLAETGGEFASNLCTAVNFQKDVRISMLLFQVVLHEGYYWRNKKMAPISLKDPNIQALTEEFVKVLTGFKVIFAHFM